MQSQQTAEQRSRTGVGGLVSLDGRRGAVRWLAVLAGLLLLPLHVGAQSPGDLDTSFGDHGVVLSDLGQDRSWANAVVVQPDGKIVAAGRLYMGSVDNMDFALARYLPDGTLDTTFSGDGWVTTDFGDYDEADAVVVQPDGKIVAAGRLYMGSVDNEDFALARYLPDGTLDTTFSGDGQVITDFGDHAEASSMVLQPDGKIVAAGSIYKNASDDRDFALARYLPDGTLDTTFSGDGRVTTDFGRDFDYAYAVAVQPNGKIVAAGFAWNRSTGIADFALARYLPNGTLDTTFSGDGQVTTNFGTNEYDYAHAVAVQPDGKIVAAGGVLAGDRDRDHVALARYLPNGTLDTTFGGDGLVTTDFGHGGDSLGAWAEAVVVQPNGRIVMAGPSYNYSTDRYDVALARYNADGTLDTNFGSTGKVSTNSEGYGLGPGVNMLARDFVMQPRDGRLVVVGAAYEGSPEHSPGPPKFFLARYHAIMCNEEVVTRVGTTGNDTIMGTSGHDVISGFGGNDVISGLGGDDILCGGSGNDTLRGAGGNDFLDGDAGTDRCDGGSGSSDQAVACEQRTNVP